jgi:hypothetical protein
MMRLKHVVTGWARGGLGYVTTLLESSGLEVGTTFGPDTSWENLEERIEDAKEVEVSPYLVPFLGSPKIRDKRATFVLRDPMRTLNSLYFHGLFHGERPSAVAAFAFNHLPGFEKKFCGKPGQAACSYLWNWLRVSQQNHPALKQLRVEEGPGAIRRHFRLPESDRYVEPYTNISYCKQRIVPSVLPPLSRDGMVRLLVELGYRETYWSPRGGHAHYVNPDWHC